MSDIVRHAGKTALRDMDGIDEESRAMRRFSKARVARNRRRAEPAIVEEQLLDIYGPDPDIEQAVHDETDVFYPGCPTEDAEYETLKKLILEGRELRRDFEPRLKAMRGEPKC